MIKFMEKLLGVFLIVLGVGLLINSVFLFKDSREFKGRSVETTATVTKVDVIKKIKNVSRNGHTKRRTIITYKTCFEYEANGDLFSSVKELSDFMESGDTFTIWYDKNNPGDVRMDNASYGQVVLTVLGGLVLVFFGGVMFLKVKEGNLTSG